MNNLLKLIALVSLLTGVAMVTVGHIEIELKSALLDSSITGQTYVKVCIQNSTEYVPFPIEDRSKCANCLSQLAPSGNKPVWNEICTGLNMHVFWDEAQIIFEVWEKQNRVDKVVGNHKLTIKDLLSKNKNHIVMNMQLNKLDNLDYGLLNSIVAWTQLSSR